MPDGKKGERLVVLHTFSAEELKAVLERLGECGLPNLWMPRPNQFFHVEELPHLGTGKLDLRRIQDGPRILACGEGTDPEGRQPG